MLDFDECYNRDHVIMWNQILLKELVIGSLKTTHMSCDNMRAKSPNHVFYATTKHIKVDYHFTREMVIKKL